MTRPIEDASTIIRLERERGELMEALKNCANGIYEEVNQSGDDDHPMLNAHRKAADHASALLARLKEGK